MLHALEAPLAHLQRVYVTVFGVREGWLEHASDASRIASLAIFLGVAGGLVLLICERSLRGRAVAAFAGMAGLVLAFCLMTGGLEDVQGTACRDAGSEWSILNARPWKRA